MKEKKQKEKGKRTGKKTGKTMEFDSSVEYEFRVKVIPGPGVVGEVFFRCGGSDGMTYDDVLDAAEDVIRDTYPDEYFPKLDVDYDTIMIKDGNSWFHVFPESKEDKIHSASGTKFLILPECTYSIAPEYKLYLSLCEHGIIDGDATPYDRDSMSGILASIGFDKDEGKEKK